MPLITPDSPYVARNGRHLSSDLPQEGHQVAFEPGVVSVSGKEMIMPRGDKSKYTDKQKRQAQHIEEGYEQRGVPEQEAARRAWATVNAEDHGGKKSSSGRGKTKNTAPTRKGRKKGGAAAAQRSAAERSASARKAAQTRARNKAGHST
jgi:hypothetical protein